MSDVIASSREWVEDARAAEPADAAVRFALAGFEHGLTDAWTAYVHARREGMSPRRAYWAARPYAGNALPAK
jgi:hypothetical protein